MDEKEEALKKLIDNPSSLMLVNEMLTRSSVFRRN